VDRVCASPLSLRQQAASGDRLERAIDVTSAMVFSRYVVNYSRCANLP